MMRSLLILALLALFLSGCQTQPPVYSTTYNFYDWPYDCLPDSTGHCVPKATKSTKSTMTTKGKAPPKYEKATEFSGGGSALKPGDW